MDFFVSVLGFVLGVVLGLVPSMHINNIANISYSFYLGSGFEGFAYFIYFLALSFSVVSFISMLYFSSPHENDIYLPFIVRFFKKGELKEFVYLYYLGIVLGLFYFVLFVPVYFLASNVYGFLIDYLVYLLVGFVVFYLLYVRSWRYFVFSVFAGVIGFLAFESSINYFYVLMPLFIGFYGLTALLFFKPLAYDVSFNDFYVKFSSYFDLFKYGFIGFLASFLCLFLPAVSPIMLLTLLYVNRLYLKGFVVSLSSMAFSDFLLSLFAPSFGLNSRSGVGVVLSQVHVFSYSEMFWLIVFSLGGVFVLFFVVLWIVRFLSLVKFIRFSYFRLFLTAYLVASVFYLTGLLGVYFLFISFLLGVLTYRYGVSPTVFIFSLIYPLIFSLIFS